MACVKGVNLALSILNGPNLIKWIATLFIPVKISYQCGICYAGDMVHLEVLDHSELMDLKFEPPIST